MLRKLSCLRRWAGRLPHAPTDHATHVLASDEFGGGGYGDHRRPRAQTNCPPLTYQPFNEAGAYHSNHFHHAFHKPLQLLTNPPPSTKMGSTHRNSCTSTHISHTSSQTYPRTQPIEENGSQHMPTSTHAFPASSQKPQSTKEDVSSVVAIAHYD